MRRELERNQGLVDLEIAGIDRILSAGDAIVGMLDASTQTSTVAVPDTLAWLVTGWNISFSPSLGAVDALLASGRLAHIDNADLRLNLAGLRELIDDAFEDEVFARKVNVEQVLPLLGDTYRLDFSIGSEFFATRGGGLTSQERVESVSLESRGYVDFPTRLPVRNAIAFRMAWLTAGRAEFSRLQTHLGEVIDLVSAELN